MNVIPISKKPTYTPAKTDLNGGSEISTKKDIIKRYILPAKKLKNKETEGSSLTLILEIQKVAQIKALPNANNIPGTESSPVAEAPLLNDKARIPAKLTKTPRILVIGSLCLKSKEIIKTKTICHE
jgi:hypothetical protein